MSAGQRATVAHPSRDPDDLVVQTVRRHADTALRLARQHSLCHDDALDAYQRALLLLVRHKDRLRAESAHSWLFTVVRHEAMAVREQRMRLVTYEHLDLDAIDRDTTASVEERVIDRDRLVRAGEALGTLKDDELRALSLQATGHSYKEIADTLGWSPRKTDRALTEGRARFRRRFAELESGDACERWQPALARLLDGSARSRELAELRPHLRNCPGCRAAVRAHREAADALGVVLPVALVSGAAPSVRHGLAARLSEAAGRLLDALAGGWHERAAGVAIKGQALMEATSAGKLTAVAASAVAIAGGGIAAADHAGDQGPARHHLGHTSKRTAASARRAHITIAATPATALREPRPAVPSTAGTGHPRRVAKAHTATRANRHAGEFTRRHPRSAPTGTTRSFETVAGPSVPATSGEFASGTAQPSASFEGGGGAGSSGGEFGR